MISRLITILICIFFLSTVPVYAQTSAGLTENDISFGLLPENPRPNSNTTITIETFSFNLNAATIRWYVNGVLKKEGKGVKELTVTTGVLGSVTNITINISTPQGELTKNIVIRPSSVDILWEAQTYTPPFFKGKSLFTHQSNIKFTAIPQISVNGKNVPATDLLYTWSKDGEVMSQQSGYGKQSIGITGSVISRNLDIEVTVEDPKTGVTAYTTTQISPTDPEIVMYVSDPLYGTQYNKAITDNIVLSKAEVTFEAVPFFFSTSHENLTNNMSYNWLINGADIDDGKNTNKRVFRKVGDTTGISNISLNATQLSKILQFSSKNILINFLKQQ